MTPAERLVAAIQAENAALAASDTSTLPALLAEKQAALAAMASDPPTPDQAAALLRLAERTHAHLARAIAVQTEVLTLVARAASPPAAGYTRGRQTRSAALALRTRA